MDIKLLRSQTKNILKEIDPCAKYYRENYLNITEIEKKYIYAETLVVSELIRITSYLYANDPAAIEQTLGAVVELLKELEPFSFYNNQKLLKDVDVYIKNQPNGKEDLIIEKLDPPALLKVIKFYDIVHLANKSDLVINYLFQVVNLIIKYDNKVTDVEKRFLERYQVVLHSNIEDTLISNSTKKKDYISSLVDDFFGSLQKANISNLQPGTSNSQSNSKPNQESKEQQLTGNVKEVAEEVYDLDKLMEELNALIGLKEVKEEVNNLVNVLKIEKIRREKNLPVPSRSLHIVFTGNPGTGKTTIGRLIAKVFKALGILEKGHLIETDRSGLVAGYVGQTAMKTTEICKKSLGGILFIDEAYSLAEGGDNDFGREAINTLLKFMEDNRDNFVVIVAGYTGNMKEFINKNPGLQSRFNKYIEFPDYTPDELFSIFDRFIQKSKLKLTEEAIVKIKEVFQKNYDARDEKFGNGRFARNFFENIYSIQANRLVSITDLNEETLCTITIEDIKV